MRYVLAKIDECDSASDVSKSVNVLVAIRWVTMAWSLVKEETVRKCFRNAGILGSDMAVVVRDEEDPFSAADECMALQGLIDKTMSGHEACPLEEYMNGDSDLPVCLDVDDNSWENTSFAHLGQEEEEEASEDKENDDQETVDDEPNEFLEEVQRFLENQGHMKEALKIGSIVDDVSCLQLAATKQTTLDSWLNH